MESVSCWIKLFIFAIKKHPLSSNHLRLRTVPGNLDISGGVELVRISVQIYIDFIFLRTRLFLFVLYFIAVDKQTDGNPGSAQSYFKQASTSFAAQTKVVISECLHSVASFGLLLRGCMWRWMNRQFVVAVEHEICQQAAVQVRMVLSRAMWFFVRFLVLTELGWFLADISLSN